MNRMRKSRCKRNNGSGIMSGGNLGAGWGFNPSTQDQIIQNPIVATPIGNCRAVEPATLRPGFMPGGYKGFGGLPGMNGGKRRKSSRKHKKGKKHSRKQYKMKGGRYGFDISNAPPGGTPWGTSYAPISSIPCEASRQTIPDSGAANTLNKVGSELWDGPIPAKGVLAGGGANPAPITWANHDAASGSPSLMVPTARYTDNPPGIPPIMSASGVPIMLHKPLNYPEMNPACLKTGGGSRKHKKSSKKSRKSNKKSKKHHRKH